MAEGNVETAGESRTTLDRWTPQARAVLRIMSALLFLEHGTQKLFSFPAGERAGALFGTLPWWAGLIEVVTGTLIVLGLFTRPAAFIASGQMAVAYWIAHGSRGFFPVNNGGDAAILYCFIFLYLFFSGPGAWSLDRSHRHARS